MIEPRAAEAGSVVRKLPERLNAHKKRRRAGEGTVKSKGKTGRNKQAKATP